jgi:hypothetical protein
MLSHSVWRARCLAKKGDDKQPDSWVNWIIEDCTQRICTLSLPLSFLLTSVTTLFLTGTKFATNQV